MEVLNVIVVSIVWFFILFLRLVKLCEDIEFVLIKWLDLFFFYLILYDGNLLLFLYKRDLLFLEYFFKFLCIFGYLWVVIRSCVLWM